MRINTGLTYYYGEVFFCIDDGKYYMVIQDHNGDKKIQVTSEFYDMAKKEFVDGE